MARRTVAVMLGFVIAAVGTPRPSAQGDLAQWRAPAYLKASNAGEDDQLSAGDNVNGVTLALSRDGNTMVAGTRREDSAASGVNGNQADNSAADSGAAYVFMRSGGTWVQQAYLKASNAQAGDGFGFAVAVSADGNTVAVSANFEDSAATGINGDQGNNAAENSGAVYVFTRTGTAWSQQAYIKASNTDPDDRFGYSLALSADGNTLASGATNEDSVAAAMNGNQADNSAGQAGAVYVFARAAGNWSQQAYIKPSNTQAGDLFGFCLALNGEADTLAVCGYDEDSAAEGIDGDQASNAVGGSGAAYVFARTGNAWTQQAYVKASNTVLQGAFGSAIALSGDGNTLAVCAADEDGQNPGVGAQAWQADRRAEERTRVAEDSAGAVYLYTRSGGRWSFQTYIKSSNIRANDYFGLRLALNRDGTVLAAGAPQQPGGGRGINPGQADFSAPESGAAYVFARTGGRWSQSAYIKAPNAQEYDLFGSGVALSGDGRTLAVGAVGEDSAATGVGGNQADNSMRDSGAVYLYTR